MRPGCDRFRLRAVAAGAWLEKEEPVSDVTPFARAGAGKTPDPRGRQRPGPPVGDLSIRPSRRTASGAPPGLPIPVSPQERPVLKGPRTASAVVQATSPSKSVPQRALRQRLRLPVREAVQTGKGDGGAW